MANDPIQGLIDFVLDVKPYHTKIAEVVVGYSQTDNLDLTFTEDFQLEIDLIIPSETEGSPPVPIQVCDNGFGAFWDRPTPFIVVGSDKTFGTITLQGDQTAPFVSGVDFEVRGPGSPSAGTFSYVVDTAAYDNINNETVITTTTVPLAGSPFFLTIPPGSSSNGDVFIIYDVVATTTGTNVITVNTTVADEFQYGRLFQIRNATTGSPPLINQTYNILTTLNQTPTTLDVVTTGPVPANTILDGEFVFAADGYDSLDLCSDIPEGLGQTFIYEDLGFQWQFFGSPQQPGVYGSPIVFTENAFQYFIIDVGSPVTNNVFVVQGNATGVIPVGVGTIEIVSAVDTPYNPASPTLNANNGVQTVVSTTYVPTDNTTLVEIGSITDDLPTGYIIPS